MSELDYAFAFLHGTFYVLMLMPFSENKSRVFGIALLTGFLTLGTFWLFFGLWWWDFSTVKAILGVVTSVLGFAGVLGRQFIVLVVAVGTGLAVGGFNFLVRWGLTAVLVEYPDSPIRDWWVLLPGITLGQLGIYYIGFFLARWLQNRSLARLAAHE